MADVKTLKKDYQNIIDQHSPKNKVIQNSVKAFWVGGLICTIGQALTDWFIYIGFSKDESSMLCTICLIFASAVLTGLNVYDKIGNYAGAGSLIPITGFANSMVSAAMEYKKEGYVFGMGAKLFTVAGPVIVFGAISSVIVGILYYFL